MPIALVKFSSDDGEGQPGDVVADHGLPGEREIGGRLQDSPPIHRQVGERIGARDEAAGKAADQRGGEADALDDRGIFVAVKSRDR